MTRLTVAEAQNKLQESRANNNQPCGGSRGGGSGSGSRGGGSGSRGVALVVVVLVAVVAGESRGG
jgi:hypothetical protein